MQAILIPVLLVVALSFVFAVILTIAAKVFFVPVDETMANLRAELPGANCGACGYAGCDDYANAMAENPEVGPNLCPVGGAEVAAKLAEILGVEAGAAAKDVAVVMCNGHDFAAKKIMEYQGLMTCAAAKQHFGGISACKFGCQGLGDCVTACQFDAIKIINGVAVVDRERCTACGACAKACPQNLIRISPEKNKVLVQCHSNEKGGVTRKACSNGCIGCGKCVTVCKFDSIKVENNLAYIDPETCKNCGACAKVCPTNAIINIRLKKTRFQPEFPVAKAAEPTPAPVAEAPKAAEA